MISLRQAVAAGGVGLSLACAVAWAGSNPAQEVGLNSDVAAAVQGIDAMSAFAPM